VPLLPPSRRRHGLTDGISGNEVLLAWAFSRWVPGAMPYPLH